MKAISVGMHALSCTRTQARTHVNKFSKTWNMELKEGTLRDCDLCDKSLPFASRIFCSFVTTCSYNYFRVLLALTISCDVHVTILYWVSLLGFSFVFHLSRFYSSPHCCLPARLAFICFFCHLIFPTLIFSIFASCFFPCAFICTFFFFLLTASLQYYFLVPPPFPPSVSALILPFLS